MRSSIQWDDSYKDVILNNKLILSVKGSLQWDNSYSEVILTMGLLTFLPYGNSYSEVSLRMRWSLWRKDSYS